MLVKTPEVRTPEGVQATWAVPVGIAVGGVLISSTSHLVFRLLPQVNRLGTPSLSPFSHPLPPSCALARLHEVLIFPRSCPRPENLATV